MKKIITKGMKLLLAAGVMVLCLAGWASRSASEPAGQKEAAEDRKQQEEKMPADVPAEADNTEADKPDDRQDILYTESGIPVYGKGEKDKIKEYLSDFPDKFLSFKEMKKLGIIGGMHNKNLYSKKETNYFDKEWHKFLTVAQRGEKMEQDRKQGKGVYDIGIEIAVVLISYTMEGDPVYDYISYINGKYYLYTDYSRDKFGGGELEFFGSYGEMAEYTSTTEGVVKYYLIQEEGVPKEKWEKWLNSEDGYDIKKINQVYEVENPDE